jgi:hypothetical protein
MKDIMHPKPVSSTSPQTEGCGIVAGDHKWFQLATVTTGVSIILLKLSKGIFCINSVNPMHLSKPHLQLTCQHENQTNA